MATILEIVSCKDTKEAKKIANALLKERVVTCANIVPKIKSHYW